MASKTRNADHGKTRLYSRWMAIFVVFSVAVLFACGDSSSTRDIAQDATSGKYEILVTILTPINGSTILFKADGTTDAKFSATHTGGTDPTEYTWTIQGPGYTSTETGSDPEAITFYALGQTSITATVTDANGITGRDTVYVMLTELGLFGSITAPATDVTILAGGSVDFNADASGGFSPYSYTWQFPGGTPNVSSTQDATVTYNLRGTFTATLTVKDTTGNTTTDSVTITVQ